MVFIWRHRRHVGAKNKTKEKEVFWEFDFIIMQNMCHNWLSFCAPTLSSYHLIEYHPFTLPFTMVVGDHVFVQEHISLPLGLAWKFIVAAVTSSDFLPGIGHFGKYHNTLCLSPQILHKHCFQFLSGLTMVPRENKNNAYAKFWGTSKEYYGIFRNDL